MSTEVVNDVDPSMEIQKGMYSALVQGRYHSLKAGIASKRLAPIAALELCFAFVGLAILVYPDSFNVRTIAAFVLFWVWFGTRIYTMHLVRSEMGHIRKRNDWAQLYEDLHFVRNNPNRPMLDRLLSRKSSLTYDWYEKSDLEVYAQAKDEIDQEAGRRPPLPKRHVEATDA